MLVSARLAITTATLVSALAVPTSSAASCADSRVCVERVARKACDQRHVLPCIHRAALHFRVSYSMLKRKAWCESRFRPRASNGDHTGLFQFRTAWPSTWATVPWRYSRHAPTSAKWSALAAGWMHAAGRGSEWACR